jgi:cytochrome b
MLLLKRIRAYHATLAILTVLAFLTTEADLIHEWLGYGVAAVIVVRLIWATTGVRQLGLMRFYPQFKGLRLDNAATHPAVSRTLLLCIATCLIGVTATGITLDGERHGALEDIHETLGNLLMWLVGAHVAYLLLFKRPLARFMLFLDPPPSDGRAGPESPAHQSSRQTWTGPA